MRELIEYEVSDNLYGSVIREIYVVSVKTWYFEDIYKILLLVTGCFLQICSLGISTSDF